MEFNIFTFGVLVILPMIIGLGVVLLTKNRLGNVLALLLGIVALAISGWALLFLGFGS